MFARRQFRASRLSVRAPHSSHSRTHKPAPALFPPVTSPFSTKCQKSAQLADNISFYLPVFSNSCALFSWTSFVFSSFTRTCRGVYAPAEAKPKSILEVLGLSTRSSSICEIRFRPTLEQSDAPSYVFKNAKRPIQLLRRPQQKVVRCQTSIGAISPSRP
jgi:hypothetical protein